MQTRDVRRFRALTALGGMLYWQNDYVAMRRAYEEALAIARELGDPRVIAQAIYDASYVSAIAHDDQLTEAMNREALAYAEQAGDRYLAANIRTNLGFLAFFGGDHQEGLAQLSGAVAVARESGDAFRVSGLLLGLGAITHADGDRAAGARHVVEALTIARDAGNRGLQAESLRALAHLAAQEGRFERAARLIGAAARLREGHEARSPAELVGRLGDPEAAALTGLGEARFADERAEGYAMTPEDAFAFAVSGAEQVAEPVAEPVSTASSA
jgi:hypothetical protein